MSWRQRQLLEPLRSLLLVPLLQFDRAVDLPLELAGAGGAVEHAAARHQQRIGHGPADPAEFAELAFGIEAAGTQRLSRATSGP
jgi:hypothetical protein